jgi:hypothetical protein
MKKTLTLLMILALIFSPKLFRAQGDNIKLGLKVAPNLAWMTSDSKYYEYNGVSGGAIIGFISDFNFSEHYGLSTGFNFSFLNGKMKFPDVVTIGKASDTGTMSRKYNFIYLEIPVMIKMKTKDFGKFCFYAQIGFGTGFRLKAKANDEFLGPGDVMMTDKSDITNETTLIREAVLIGIGTEFHIDESTSLLFGLSYSNTLNNVLKGNNSQYPDVKAKGLLNYAELNIGVLF